MSNAGSRTVSACAIVAALATGCGSSQTRSTPTPSLGQTQGATPAVSAPKDDQLAATPVAAQPKQAPAPAKTMATPPPRTYSVRPFADLEKRALARLRLYQADQQRQRKLTAAEEVHAALAGVRDLTEAVLIASGLEYATFDLADGGRSVTVNVDKKSACSLTTSDQDKIESRIVNASDLVEQVKLRIDGSSLSVERYLKKNCAQPAAPDTAGKLLVRRSGSGTLDMPAIHITTKAWKIVYNSSSALLQVYVYKDGKLQAIAVNRHGRGAGTSTVSGPGTFKLQVAGTGQWSVSAYAVTAGTKTSG